MVPRTVLILFKDNWAKVLLLFLGVFLPLAIFADLADDVVKRGNFAWDEPVLRWLHAHASPGLDSAMVLVSEVGMWWGLVPFDLSLSAFLLGRRQWTRGIFFILAVGGAGLLNVLTKEVFGRERPALWLSVAPAQNFSFPSGHAMGSSAAVAASAVLVWRTRARWPVIVIGTAWV